MAGASLFSTLPFVALTATIRREYLDQVAAAFSGRRSRPEYQFTKHNFFG
jgi:hypothetical protein